MKGNDNQGSARDTGSIRKRKKKSNAAPKNKDDQEIPYRLRELMWNTRKMKEEQMRKKSAKPKNSALAEISQLQTDIPIPKFRRGKRESELNYLHRMERETQHVMFLSKNQIDRQPEIEEAKVKPGKEAKVKPGKEAKVKPEVMKSERKKNFDRQRLDRLLKKKNERKEKKLEKDIFTDHVKFGDVVKQPPSLTAKPRKGASKEKPGQKSLLLKSLFNASPGIKPRASSMARQRLMLEERARVVKAYRDLKKLKQKSQTQTKYTASSMNKFD
ncbi:coiled-coil domain-containing protein 137 isoform X2 [Protopterus annectens]|uniref:coiled-coil domain-containing protein 137 isoform X2 n=1 Tax=Protopterus annectens TaxID=7888 RepID=UPI001CF961BE|nr:coiled-coil domain-containing protein 137 isoform X2 [Protopterus annectens]